MAANKHTNEIALIACEVLKPEIERILDDEKPVRVHYLEQSLHRAPQNMAEKIQAVVDQVTGTVNSIILGYGLCSNGIVGVTARKEELIVPRCHDCISFFLGSPENYLKEFNSRPGSYYLTPGWIREGKDPLHIMKEEYYPRYGEETAEWAMKEELKHYTHIVLINTGGDDVTANRSISRANADYFGLEYVELSGQNLTYFNYLIHGPYKDEYFIRINPGEKVEQHYFFS